MLKRFMTVLVLASALLSTNLVRAGVDADTVVRETSEKILSAIAADRKIIDTDQSHLFKLVEDIVLPHFDFNKMARKVVDKQTWDASSDDLKTRFVSAFRDYLVKTYATALIKFDIDKISYGQSRISGKSVLVRTSVALKNTSPVPIEYRLYLDSQGSWKVTDIVVDGISLITNRQGVYKKAAQKSGLQGLIDILTKDDVTEQKS